MACFVCGTPADSALTECRACGTALVDVSSTAIPGMARVVGTKLGDRMLGGPVATLFAAPPTDVVPTVLDLTDSSDDAQSLAVGSQVDDTAAGSAVEFDHNSLFAGPDGIIDDPVVEDAAERAPQDTGAINDLFGEVTPSFLTLGDPVQNAAFGLDDTNGGPAKRRRRTSSRRSRPKVELDAKTLRPIILTALLVLVTAWVGVQTLTQDPTAAPTTTVPLASGPEITHDTASLMSLAGGHAVSVTAGACGPESTAGGFLLDASLTVTTRTAVAGDATPTITRNGQTTTATVLAWSWSPDLAILRLDEPVEPAVAAIATADGISASRFDQLSAIIGGSESSTLALTVEAAVPGWGGSHHALAVTTPDPVPPGTLVMTGQGQIAGMVSTGPNDSPVVVTFDALAQPIDALARTIEPMPIDCTIVSNETAPRWTGNRLPIDATASGSDPLLDELSERCSEEVWMECDDLRYVTDPTSEYHTFGSTCGGRLAAEPTSCSLRIDVVAGASLGNFLLGDCVVLSRSDAGTSRPVACDRAHEAQVVHLVQVDGLRVDETGQLAVSAAVTAQVAEACESATREWITATYWDRPLEIGVLRPIDVDDPFACFVYQPGVTLDDALS